MKYVKVSPFNASDCYLALYIAQPNYIVLSNIETHERKAPGRPRRTHVSHYLIPPVAE